MVVKVSVGSCRGLGLGFQKGSSEDFARDSFRVLEVLYTQRLQNHLIDEYTLNLIRVPSII